MPKLRVAMRREEKKEKKCNNRVIRRVRTRNIVIFTFHLSSNHFFSFTIFRVQSGLRGIL